MTTVNEIEGHDIVFVKGAVDVLLKKCTRLANPAAGQGTGLAGQRPGESGRGTEAVIPCRTLSSSDRQRILDQNSRWSARGSGFWPLHAVLSMRKERITVIPAYPGQKPETARNVYPCQAGWRIIWCFWALLP